MGAAEGRADRRRAGVRRPLLRRGRRIPAPVPPRARRHRGLSGGVGARGDRQAAGCAASPLPRALGHPLSGQAAARAGREPAPAADQQPRAVQGSRRRAANARGRQHRHRASQPAADGGGVGRSPTHTRPSPPARARADTCGRSVQTAAQLVSAWSSPSRWRACRWRTGT